MPQLLQAISTYGANSRDLTKSHITLVSGWKCFPPVRDGLSTAICARHVAQLRSPAVLVRRAPLLPNPPMDPGSCPIECGCHAETD